MPVIVFLLQSVNRCSRKIATVASKARYSNTRSFLLDPTPDAEGALADLLRVRCGSTETPKQAGSSESPVLKMLFIRAATHPYPIASVRTRSIGLYMLPNPNNSLIRFCKRRLSRHNRRWRFRARRVRCGSFFAELRAFLFLRRAPSKGAKDFPSVRICFR